MISSRIEIAASNSSILSNPLLKIIDIEAIAASAVAGLRPTEKLVILFCIRSISVGSGIDTSCSNAVGWLSDCSMF